MQLLQQLIGLAVKI